MTRTRIISIYSLAVTALLFMIVLSSYDTIGPQLDPLFQQNQVQKTTNYGPQNVRAIKMPSSIEFAYERVPLENFDVKERLDKELLRNTFYHSHMFRYLKLSRRYFPTIERILAEQGVPNDFKYLAVAESGLRNATSSAGAKGIWQFMKASARKFNIVIDDEVDERYNIEKVTVAACKHLKESKRRFGTWAKAAAAYNMGGPRLSKNLKSQKVSSYWDLHLNSETSAYLFRIIAIKTIMENPASYGFNLDGEDYYAPLNSYSTKKVSSGIVSLTDFAIQNGTTYRKLKIYNPWLRQPYLRNRSKRTYTLKVPYN